jgi:hypothetical protein
MAYLDDYMLTLNGDFQYRVQLALASIALDIQAEAVNTANHSQRSAYALLVLANLPGYAQRMAPAIVTDGQITGASTDAQLKSRCSAVWNAFCVQS